MIEFKATYQLCSKADPIAVLVQYDGMVLHIWHTSEPFHRLALSDEFHVRKSFSGQARNAVRLPNGSRILTDDRSAIEQLSLKMRAGRKGSALPQSLLLALLGSMSMGAALWWLAI
jgi:hypothetical protein